MDSTPEEIALFWRRQTQRGYLKLATLFALTREPLHGYQLMKRIGEMTLGVITPTAGGIYPALRELEEEGLIQGKWRPEERKKVYAITEKGREVFKIAVERHFELASSIRSWMLKELSNLKIIDVGSAEIPSLLTSAARVLLLDEEASTGERVEALKKLRERFHSLALLLNGMISRIDCRIEELRSTASSTDLEESSP